MNLSSFAFHTLNWSSIPKEEHKGETGVAYWQVFRMNEIRIRKVEYSPGYLADHWCRKGHIILCLTAGMTYFVGDNCEAHRTSTISGCKLFIVD